MTEFRVCVTKTPAAAVRRRVGQTPEAPSEESYKDKEPRFLRAGLPGNRISEIEISFPRAYLGAVESVLPVVVDFLEDFLWCFLWVVLLLDLAGADESAGVVVSAASTGPAASVNTQTTGTSFLNIDRLHCKDESLSGWKSAVL
jgi:hypothetical protein